MSELGEKISVVKTGDELFDMWKDIGQRLPRTLELRQQWDEFLRERAITYLAAKVGDMAVGSVFIRWSGPSILHKDFSTALKHKFHGRSPIPAIEKLFVSPDARGYGLGNKLTAAAENNIKRHKNVTQMAALNVEIDNIYALPIYNNRGYKIIPFEGQNAVLLNRPTPGGNKSKKKVYMMAKDLSKKE